LKVRQIQNKEIRKDKKLEYVGEQETYQQIQKSQKMIRGEDWNRLHKETQE